MQSLTILTRPLAPLLILLALSACTLQAPQMAGQPASGQETDISLRLAQATAASGEHAKAVKLFEKVLAAEPDNVEALAGAGDSYARIGQNSRAEAILLRAHDLAPRDAGVLSILGRVRLAMNRPAEALADYDSALKLQRANVSALTGKGVALDTLSRHAEAQEVYTYALKLYPSNFILRSNYALSLALTETQGQAIAILQELVRDPVAAPHVRGNLALVYGLAGRDNDARATLALDLSPSEIEQNIQVYQALRRMMLEGRPVGALVFA
ncbi:tetratricopeptide repeat protein [Oceanicola sp. S124]|uniref:tetratricopeptide repeat protein n=1 Tax=Oceanicola sp. S124 TaxID=1042378 RepID=UPI0002558610|nr:tetratricopeptide repeat protein [Oceanicola sp. S124]